MTSLKGKLSGVIVFRIQADVPDTIFAGIQRGIYFNRKTENRETAVFSALRLMFCVRQYYPCRLYCQLPLPEYRNGPIGCSSLFSGVLVPTLRPSVAFVFKYVCVSHERFLLAFEYVGLISMALR